MVTLQAFLGGVREIIATQPTYQLGQDGRSGTCDCIGLIIGGLRRAGGLWRGTHGSNWAARNAMQLLEQTPRVELGTILYKAILPGESGYNLPTAYRTHHDQRDYYHVGVVLSVSPLQIAHCTSWAGGSGIKIDTAMGRWRFGGRLAGVDYSASTETDKVASYAIVTAPNGGTVNLRSNPSTASNNILSKPRSGERVFVHETGGAWWKVNDGNKTGWMMAKYLRLEGEAATPDVDIAALLDEADGHLTRLTAIIKALREVC